RAPAWWRTPCSRRGRTGHRSGDRTGSRRLLGSGTAHRGERATVETVGERDEVAVPPPRSTAWQIQRLDEPGVPLGGQPDRLVGRQRPPGEGLVAPPEPGDEAADGNVGVGGAHQRAAGQTGSARADSLARNLRPGAKTSDATVRPSMAGLFSLVFALGGWRAGLSRLSDNSFFWHLRTGRRILD